MRPTGVWCKRAEFLAAAVHTITIAYQYCIRMVHDIAAKCGAWRVSLPIVHWSCLYLVSIFQMGHIAWLVSRRFVGLALFPCDP